MSIIFGCAGLISIIKSYLADNSPDPDLDEAVKEALRQIEMEFMNPPPF